MSLICIGPDPGDTFSSRLSDGMTDVLIACEQVVSAGIALLTTLRPGLCAAILNPDVAPTGDLQRNKHLYLCEVRLRLTVSAPAKAQAYLRFVENIRRRVATVPGRDPFVRQVALTPARLMAYRDEDEVARLYTDSKFAHRMREQFSGDFELNFNLAPPIPGGAIPKTTEEKAIRSLNIESVPASGAPENSARHVVRHVGVLPRATTSVPAHPRIPRVGVGRR